MAGRSLMSGRSLGMEANPIVEKLLALGADLRARYRWVDIAIAAQVCVAVFLSSIGGCQCPLMLW
jgi:hypothetical protein